MPTKTDAKHVMRDRGPNQASRLMLIHAIPHVLVEAAVNELRAYNLVFGKKEEDHSDSKADDGKHAAAIRIAHRSMNL